MSEQPNNTDSGTQNDNPAALPLWDVFRGGLVVSLPAAIALGGIAALDAVKPWHAAGAPNVTSVRLCENLRR